VKGIGVEDTLKAVTKLVFKSLSLRYGDGAPAPSAPGRAPGPPRSMPPPTPPTPAPPLAVSTDDLLGELDLDSPEPEASPLRPAADLPPIELEENTPVGSLYPAPAVARPATPPPPPPPPSLPPLPPQPTRPPVAAHKPQTTLVSNRNEADELRLSISGPGTAEDELEMDLEAIDDFDHPTHAKLVPAGSPETTAPEPVLQPELAGATEVEVPIDIEVAPGTTRISLNIKLLLSLRRR
jgi:hypothetical protein